MSLHVHVYKKGEKTHIRKVKQVTRSHKWKMDGHYNDKKGLV